MSGALLNSDHHVLNHWIFSLLRNPVTNKKHYRLYVINKIPQIRVLDFQKVKLKVSARSLLCQFKNEVMWVTSLQWNRIEGLGNLFIWHNYRDMRLQSWWRVYIHLHRTCIMAVLSSTDFYISFFCDRMSGTHTSLSQKTFMMFGSITNSLWVKQIHTPTGMYIFVIIESNVCQICFVAWPLYFYFEWL